MMSGHIFNADPRIHYILTLTNIAFFSGNYDTNLNHGSVSFLEEMKNMETVHCNPDLVWHALLWML